MRHDSVEEVLTSTWVSFAFFSMFPWQSSRMEVQSVEALGATDRRGGNTEVGIR
jgi:hypothetical protein